MWNRIILGTTAITVLLMFYCFSTTMIYASDHTNSMSSSSLVPSPTSIPNTVSNVTTSVDTGKGLDPAIIAAIIGVGVAFIAGGFVVFQTIYSAKAQRRLEQEMELLRRELDEQYKAKERDEQRKITDAEVIRREMLLARSNSERAEAYRRMLHTDPRISRLHILDMSHPLEVTSVYVQVRVHEDTRQRYGIDPLLSAAEMQRDPNALLRAGRLSLERRVSTAIDPDEAIRKYTHCVIVGDPGAGKTTLLKFLTLKASDGALKDLPDLPIYVELNAFSASTEFDDLLDFIANEWDKRYAFFKAEARNYVDGVLKAGKAMLLLDALDETVIGEQVEKAETSYGRVVNVILQAATRYPRASIVVTVRKAGYQQRIPLVGFTELEVMDFRLEEMQQFVNNWFTSSDDQREDHNQEINAVDLNTKLERNPRIQALAANPLLLSLIVLVYEAQLDLPERRADLYKRCIEVLLTEWDAKRNIRRRREFKPEQKRRLLIELARHFHLQGRRYFPETELLAEIAKFLPVLDLSSDQDARVLQEIANENGLLKEQAKGWYGFLHLTLQEYFVAQYVNDHNELTTLLKHIGDPWWEEVLLLYAGQTPDVGPLVQRLLGESGLGESKQQDDLFYTNLTTAGRCLAASPTIRQPSIREDVINRLFDIVRMTPYSLTRKQAAEALAEIGTTNVTDRLLRMLGDEAIHPNIRGSIALALGTFGERTIARDMLRLLEDEQLDLNVRGSIALALGTFGERTIVGDLLHLLDDKQVEWYVRECIASALGSLGERTTAKELLRLLNDRQLDADVSKSIALALGTLGERSVVRDLLRLLEDEQLDLTVRGTIASALGTLGERTIVGDLLRLLKSEKVDLNVRGSIALALGTLGERTVAQALLLLLSDNKIGWYVQGSIALALGTLGERSVIPDLQKKLVEKNININVRASVASALGVLGDRSVTRDLRHLLGNKQIDLNVHKSIVSALGALGDGSVAHDLLRLLGNEQADPNVRGSIAVVLGSLGEHSIVPELLQMLSNTQINTLVRVSVASAIEALASDDASVRTLASLLQTSDIGAAIYDALWRVSRRAGARIFVTDSPASKGSIEVVYW
jgi:HEAT repeat protein